MIFAWDDDNRLHLAKHNVSPEEAEEIVLGSHPPYPTAIGESKLVVWGQTSVGRHLQVIFVFKAPDEIAYETLPVEDWLEIERDDTAEVVRIIHAMDLTPAMKARYRKRRR